MRKFFLILLFFLPLSLLSEDDLDAFVDQQHYKLFNYINKNEDLIDSDNKSFINGFELTIKEIIDPMEISKRVMGKKIYDKATKTQRDNFNKRFKNTLFESYSSALKEIDYEDLKIVSHYHPKENMDKAIVRLKVNLSGRSIDFVYRMRKIDGKWKIIGFIIDGIDLISIFRKQFINLFLEGNKSINYAINNWDLPKETNG